MEADGLQGSKSLGFRLDWPVKGLYRKHPVTEASVQDVRADARCNP